MGAVGAFFFISWGLIMTVIALVSAQGFAVLLCLAIGWGPMVLALKASGSAAKGLQARHAEAMAAAGIAAGKGWDHHEDGSGIGIDPKGQRIVLWVGGASKAYDYGDVRDWETSKEETERAFLGRGGGWVGSAGVAAKNRRATENTGLFIRVKDVSHPKWRIAMSNRGVQDRWMEILRQEINEGGIAR